MLYFDTVIFQVVVILESEKGDSGLKVLMYSHLCSASFPDTLQEQADCNPDDVDN